MYSTSLAFRFLCLLLSVGSLMSPVSANAEGPNSRPALISDIAAVDEISDLQLSADNTTLLYTVSRTLNDLDRRGRELWRVPASVAGAIPSLLMATDRPFSQPRWLPNNRRISFLAEFQGRQQVWTADTNGQNASPVTHVTGVISDYQWSPDGKRLLLSYRTATPPGSDKPWVIDRYQFKRDGVGYVTGSDVVQLYLIDVKGQGASEPQRLTRDSDLEERQARWSPDGKFIAFLGNDDQRSNSRRTETLFVVPADTNELPKALAPARSVSGNSIAWAPDSQRLAFLTSENAEHDFREHLHLASIRVDGSGLRPLTKNLDLGVSAPAFSSDGRNLRFLVTGDRRQGVFDLDLKAQSLKPWVDGAFIVSEFAQTPKGIAYIASGDTRPPEVFVATGLPAKSLPDVSLSRRHDALNREVTWQPAQAISFKSSDGSLISGLLTLPAGSSGKNLPTLLRIHGGPNAQDSHGFVFERQLFAARGYAVLNVNYRGSAGRGRAYSHAIFADWGNLEVKDLLAGVDYLVDAGIADPQRLGIGGWSFGGLLTDYVIASDKRFKAAISGAGSGNRLGLFGHDQWIQLWQAEYPAPWQAPDQWIKVSYPFFHADRINTPTLFLGGDKDWSVPLLGSEQMYQALKVTGVPTQLIVYPGEGHQLTRPSFVVDRLQRYLDWYGRWIVNP